MAKTIKHSPGEFRYDATVYREVHTEQDGVVKDSLIEVVKCKVKVLPRRSLHVLDEKTAITKVSYTVVGYYIDFIPVHPGDKIEVELGDGFSEMFVILGKPLIEDTIYCYVDVESDNYDYSKAES